MITLTLGTSKANKVWNQRQEYSWDQLCEAFSVPEIGPKDGNCYVPAVFSGNVRNMEYSQKIDIVVLDLDSGETMDEVSQKILEKDICAFIHSTHSHMTCETRVSLSAVEKYEAAGGNIVGFMCEKKGYLQRISKTAVRSTILGKDILVRHAPVPKYRVIIPLQKSWHAEDYPDIHTANEAWRERIHSLASWLGVSADQSCTDTSRLFYTPRIATPNHPFEKIKIPGNHLDIWAIAPAEKNIDAPLFAARQHDGQEQRSMFDAGKMIGDFNLTRWAWNEGRRFQIADALHARSPGIFTSRRSGVKQHIYCPFDDEHTSARDETGTYVVNAADIGSSGLARCNGFTIQCSHNACTGRDRLDFLIGLINKGHLTVGDLTDQRFLVGAARRECVDTSQVVDAKNDMQIPPFPEPTGLLHDIKQHILDTAKYPHPELSLAAAIAIVGVACGQEYAYENLRTNVYFLGLAPSSSGKGHVIGMAERILRESDLGERVGGSSIASGAAVISRMVDNPNTAYLLDEFGMFLRAMTGANSGAHVREIVQIWTELYTKANGTYTTKDKADRTLNATRQIKYPCLSVFGITNEVHVWESLTRENVADGSLARFTMFKARQAFPPPQSCDHTPSTPKSIISRLKGLSEARQQRNANLSGNLASVGKDEPIFLTETENARAMFRDLEEIEHQQKVKHYENGTGLYSVIGRSVEMTKKIAMIHALSNNRIEINKDDAAWAEEVVGISIMTMLNGIEENIADTTKEKYRNRIVAAIKKKGKDGYPRANLAKAFRYVPKLMRLEILEDLAEAGEITEVDVNTSGRGAPRIMLYAMK